jgi:hypothetical protein
LTGGQNRWTRDYRQIEKANRIKGSAEGVAGPPLGTIHLQKNAAVNFIRRRRDHVAASSVPASLGRYGEPGAWQTERNPELILKRLHRLDDENGLDV